MAKKIVDGKKRELKKSDIGIEDYYKNLADKWNELSDKISEQKDSQTTYSHSYYSFFYELLYMWDMIIQTKEEYEQIIDSKKKEIETLKEKLKPWTEQQGGRKPILTDEQRQKIKQWKAKNISNREIAKNLEVSEGTIRNELKRQEQ